MRHTNFTSERSTNKEQLDKRHAGEQFKKNINLLEQINLMEHQEKLENREHILESLLKEKTDNIDIKHFAIVAGKELEVAYHDLEAVRDELEIVYEELEVVRHELEIVRDLLKVVRDELKVVREKLDDQESDENIRAHIQNEIKDLKAQLVIRDATIAQILNPKTKKPSLELKSKLCFMWNDKLSDYLKNSFMYMFVGLMVVVAMPDLKDQPYFRRLLHSRNLTDCIFK